MMTEENSDEEECKDLSDDDIIRQCEQALNNIPESSDKHDLERSKRSREKSEGSSEEGFISVVRRKPKRLIRSDSIISRDDNVDCQMEFTSEDKYDIWVTSLEVLPKQMAMARLLKSENIQNIASIVYKSPYKIRITFEKKEDADSLIQNTKFKVLGYKCSSALRKLSYGLIKGVDLDISETEVFENIKSSTEIISIKRLKRYNTEGKWVESESVRICFKGTTYPTYVYAYDYRFKVEPFVFPVSQCSGCWRFGHYIKFCPSKKILCPKCGGNHVNCETQTYICINCKGSHMSIDKTCPRYRKEKKIREIMSHSNVTYGKAMLILSEQEKSGDKQKEDTIFMQENSTIKNKSLGPTCMTINCETSRNENIFCLESEEVNCLTELKDTGKEDDGTSSPIISHTHQRAKSNKAKNISGRSYSAVVKNQREEATVENTVQDEGTKPECSKNNRNSLLYKLWAKVEDILFKNMSFQEKFSSLIKSIFEEFKHFVMNLIKEGNWLENLFSTING